MKVTVNEVKTFKPITIILETAEEARAMWAALNLSTESVKRHLSEQGIGLQDPDTLYKMWLTFTHYYDPRVQG